MPSSEERRTGARMPSLLTPAQQAEADRNRILTKLEHGKADPPAARPRSRKLAWGAGGAAALALVGGAAFWNGGPAPVAPHAAPMITAANVAPARVEPPAAKPAEPEVSAAAILYEPAPAAAPKVEPSAKPAPDDLRRALEEGTGKKHAPRKAVAKADTPNPRAKPASKQAPAAPRKTPARATLDSDVALLSALVAHTQASRGASEATPALKKELKACTRLKGSKARDCREEACLGFENSVAACKGS